LIAEDEIADRWAEVVMNTRDAAELRDSKS